MFEGLTKAFNFLSDKLTLNMLVVTSLIFLALLLVWCITSLLVNNYVFMKRNCIKCIKLLQGEGLTRANYYVFSSIFAKFPITIRFGWKKYEQKKDGKASDYLLQGESLNTQLNGGIFKQNRSLMRSVIIVFTCIITLFSFALISTFEGLGSEGVTLTNTLVKDALILPLVFYILCMVIYYVYASIRHLEYKNLVETYYDLVDYLDEKVDLEDVFGSKNTAVGLISSVYTNETLQELVDKKKKQQKRIVYSDENVGKTKLNNLNNGILGREDVDDKTDENVVQSFEKVNTVLEPKITSDSTIAKIKNESEFVEVIGEVEELVDTIGKEKNKEKRTQLEKTVNKKIKALTDYKQKAKSQKESVAIKKTTKGK